MTKKKTICIVPLLNSGAFVRNELPLLGELEDIDICVVDDGSTDGTIDLLEEVEGVISILHEVTLGYGSALYTGCDYARDHAYERIIVLNPENDNPAEDIKAMVENLDYGYDLVSCSRVLENKMTDTMDTGALNITTGLGNKITEITRLDITDPLSGIFAIEMQALEPMDLTDETHGFLLQMWVQSDHFNLTSIEIPATSGDSFGFELEGYEDPLGFFLAILETEKYLYPEETIN